MLSILIVVTALAKFGFVLSDIPHDLEIESKHVLEIFSEDDMTPEFTEQLGRHDHTTDIKKRSDVVREKKEDPFRSVVKTNSTAKPAKSSIAPHPPDDKKKGHRVHLRQDTDVYDREDHVTQYLSDHLVNTDSEITSLQASELEDDREGIEVNEDWFFAFLTGQQKPIEVEGAWSKPVEVDLVKQEPDDDIANMLLLKHANDVTDLVYKH